MRLDLSAQVKHADILIWCARNETSAVRVFMLLFSIFVFSDHQSLNIENESSSKKTYMQKFDNRSLIQVHAQGPKNEF